jgi:hypothetical protein
MQGINFLSGSKHILGHFLGFFEGLDLFDPKIALHYAQDNLGVKKVSSPLEESLEMPQYMFCP